MAPVNASKGLDEMPEPTDASDRVEIVECACCGMAEDCTPTYIKQTREVFHGRWICGLCAEAVAEKMKSGGRQGLLTREEALEAHMALSRSFNRTTRLNPNLSIALSMQDFARKISERRSTAAGRGGGGGNLGGSKNKFTRAMSCVARLDVCVEKSQSH